MPGHEAPQHAPPHAWEVTTAEANANAAATPSIAEQRIMRQPHAHVLLVRHGERFDEVRGNNWYEIAPKGFEYDPPLTTNGAQQAVAAARALVPHWDEHKFDFVYCSPALRCVQTAVSLVGELQRLVGTPIRIELVSGLAACCAAAVMYGPSYPIRPLDELIELSRPYSNTHVVINYKTPREWEWFHPCVARLAAEVVKGPSSHAQSSAIPTRGQKTPLVVCVTHREGLRDLASASGWNERMRVPYCATAIFGFAHPPPKGEEMKEEKEKQGCVQAISNAFRPSNTIRPKKEKKPKPTPAEPGSWSIVQHWVEG